MPPRTKTTFTLLCLLLLLQLARSDCTHADSYQCITSLCSNYYWVNGTCKSNSTSTCTPQASIWTGSACTSCATLPAATCTSKCPDFYMKGSTCTACWTTYSTNCVACTATACTQCSFSSNTVLASNGLSCVTSTCTDPNCVACYTQAGVQKCQTCKSGYNINSNYGCTLTTCNIPYCRQCTTGSTTCALCKNQGTDYQLSTDYKSCNPICSDVNCVTCLRPAYCGTCATGYKSVSGVCQIDCTQNVVPHCSDCVTLTTCKACASGYTLIKGGSQCVINCNDPKCQVCSAAATCVTCATGYYVNSGKSCSRAICGVQYCATCLNTTACSTCQTYFTLSSNKLTCTPTCTLSITNCVTCSDNTHCSGCSSGFSLAANFLSCNAICSISSCSVCASATTCKTCATGYVLSTTAATCNLYCPVLNCLTCSTSTTCSACKTGLNLVTFNSKQYCVIQCGIGQVNTGTAITPVCAVCSSQITYCMTCDTSNGATVCTQCPTGYFIDGAGNCQLCSGLIPNCWACSNAATCTVCKDTYSLNANNGCDGYTCASTVTNCLTCSVSSSTVCTKCINGFTLSSSGTCSITCAPSLVFNPKIGICDCPYGTFYTGSACVACDDPNCYLCQVSGCMDCSNGYYLKDTNCYMCPRNCLTCSDYTNCLKCYDGYYVNDDGTCSSTGNGRKASKCKDGNYYSCPSGCDSCTLGGDNQLKCLQAAVGFSIIGGKAVSCDPSCKSCSDTTNTSCTACYSSLALVGGTCKSCFDPNALTCAALNPNYALSCVPGYTATFSSKSSGAPVTSGVCVACAKNCLQCDSAGPGTCDTGKCAQGYVILVGTKNCTACFGGCPQCTPYAPTQCNNCPDGQFKGSNKQCQPCSSSCATCSAKTTCTSCPAGTTLISATCYTNPPNCVSLANPYLCTACLAGYKLTASKDGCVLDFSCNATGSCVDCPEGYYLSSHKCFACTGMPSKCISCRQPSLCNRCADGYYVDASRSFTCAKCASHCLTCVSSSYCNSAVDGYYVIYGLIGTSTGQIQPCSSPCATCQGDPKRCLSCNKGYSLNGTQCLSDSRCQTKMVIGGGSGTNALFLETDNLETQLFNAILGLNRLLNAFCKKLPKKYYDTSSSELCQQHIKANHIGSGSLITAFNIAAESFPDQATALSQLQTSFTSTDNEDGFTQLSVSMSVVGFSTSSTSSEVNLGLILGLSIPLTVLLILIIVILAMKNKEDIIDTAEREDAAAETVDQVQKYDHSQI